MKETRLYYTAPPEKCFQELLEKAIEIYSEYDDEFGYASEKIKRINSIDNIEDNFMYIVAMFDIDNQYKLAKSLSKETRLEVRKRMINGGQPSYLNPF